MQVNRLTSTNGPPGLVSGFRHPDFEVSWAGAVDNLRGYCLGSSDGKLLFTDEQMAPISEPIRGSASGEAINGVAASKGWLAVTTRAEVNFMRPPSPDGSPQQTEEYQIGAHGVTVAPSGSFVIPLGHAGMIFVEPGSVSQAPRMAVTTDEAGFSFYRALALRGDKGQDVIACAGRRGGLGVLQVRSGEETRQLSIQEFEGLDIVDVCGLTCAEAPMAVAAIATDGTIVFVRDLLGDAPHQNLRFETVKGTAYRLLSARGDLIVLTSRGLYVLSQLAAAFLGATPAEEFATPILTLDMEAVDANIVRDRWLLVVDDGVPLFDIELIQQSAPQNSRPAKIGTADRATIASCTRQTCHWPAHMSHAQAKLMQSRRHYVELTQMAPTSAA